MRKLTCTLAILALLGGLVAIPTTAHAAPWGDAGTASPDEGGLVAPWLQALQQAITWLLPSAPTPGGGADPGRLTAASGSGSSPDSGTETGPSPFDPSDQAGEMIDPNG